MGLSKGVSSHNHSSAAGGGTELNPTTMPNMIPTGTILQMITGTIPTGWLECNGQAISRTTYADLFQELGTLWGAGDGSTTFNVPDCRGRVILGKGQGSGLTLRDWGDTGGEEDHTQLTGELAQHSHTLTVQSGVGAGTVLLDSDSASSTTKTYSSNNQGSSTPFNVMPPFVTCGRWCIKT